MNQKIKQFAIDSFEKVARDMVKNPEALKYKLNKTKEKLSKKSVKQALGNSLEDFELLFRLIKSYSNGKYKDVSNQSLILSIIALIYFLTPTDFVPDMLLGLGFLDDVAILRWVFSSIKKDLDKFKAWEKNKIKEEN